MSNRQSHLNRWPADRSGESAVIFVIAGTMPISSSLARGVAVHEKNTSVLSATERIFRCRDVSIETSAFGTPSDDMCAKFSRLRDRLNMVLVQTRKQTHGVTDKNERTSAECRGQKGSR